MQSDILCHTKAMRLTILFILFSWAAAAQLGIKNMEVFQADTVEGTIKLEAKQTFILNDDTFHATTQTDATDTTLVTKGYTTTELAGKAPASGSANYIWNNYLSQQNADLWVKNGRFDTSLKLGTNDVWHAGNSGSTSYNWSSNVNNSLQYNLSGVQLLHTNLRSGFSGTLGQLFVGAGATTAAGWQSVTTAIGDNYIKNGTSQQTANFNISGKGVIGGNLLIGTSSNDSWRVGENVFKVGARDAIHSYADITLNLTHGGYINSGGSWTYNQNTEPFVNLVINAGQFRFRYKEIGTIGATFTPTELLTIKSTQIEPYIPIVSSSTISGIQYNLSGVQLLHTNLRSGFTGTLNDLFVSNGTTTAPSWKSLNTALGGGLLTTGKILLYDGTKLANSPLTVLNSDSIKYSLGVAINENSSDVTLSGNSNLAVPTEKAVKTYVDGKTANSAYWDAAYNDKINSAAFSGTTTKILTLTQQDGGTVTAQFTDSIGSDSKWTNSGAFTYLTNSTYDLGVGFSTDQGTYKAQVNGKIYATDDIIVSGGSSVMTVRQADIKMPLYLNGVSGSAGYGIFWGRASNGYPYWTNSTDTYVFNLTSASDFWKKKDFRPIHNALEKVISINTYAFNWRDSFPKEAPKDDINIIVKDDDKEREATGVIAQEIEKIMPEIVSEMPMSGYKAVDYSLIVPYLIEAIKEQQKQIEELKQLIKNK